MSRFNIEAPDYTLSPYTGLKREHWIEAGKYLLKGIFDNISSYDAPVIMPRKDTAVTYPHLTDPKEAQETQLMAERFEGLARSFFIAAPLIHDDPELTVSGYKIRDYYKRQVIASCTPGNPNYVGGYDELQKLLNNTDPSRAFQQTVETCALVICLADCRNEIWDTYTSSEKDIIAKFLSGYAHAGTVPQNWRLFNMLDMAFLNMEGYTIDHEIMAEHAQSILNYYAGDGWYRDGHSFDYYSCWAFNVYAPIWNNWYGYENVPYIARKFEEYSNNLMETYADFFDRDGFTNMWGRSNIYRNAATSAFCGNLMLREPTADPGLSRRIMSGSLLQFMSREDFLYNGIPTLGFYGEFAPLVQGYSCAESPFWLGKAFLCLNLPAEHPFWTARENNGTWEKLKSRETKVTTLNGPALCFSNHEANGETILRTGKVVKNCGDEHGMWNYSKLSYNTKYPWESAPCENIEAQQYVLCDKTHGTTEKCNVTFWHGERDKVLYRRQFFDYKPQHESHWRNALNLADFTVENGIFRVDKLRTYYGVVELTLGAYGFPDNGTEITRMEKDNARAIILKGTDFNGREKQLAMTVYDGWEDIDYIESRGTNPDSERSIIVYAKTEKTKQYAYGPHILISQVITKESHEPFTEDEIFPLKEIEYTDAQKLGGYGPVRLLLKNGAVRVVDFEGIEGALSL